MNLTFKIIQLKESVKVAISSNKKYYKLLQSLYRKTLQPLEKLFIKNKTKSGFESEAALSMCSLLPINTLDAVFNYYKPKSLLDVGCGTGRSLVFMKKKGVEVVGLENSDLAINVSRIKEIIKHDLTLPINLNRQFDVVWCYEVAEHLPEWSANTLINTLTTHGSNIVLSAARPGQGGEGHINEQPASYWVEKMFNKGYIVDDLITEKIRRLNEMFSNNINCFKKIK